MPNINLIREQRIATLKKEKTVRFAFLGTIGIACIAGLIAFGLIFDAARLSIEANSLEEKKKKMEPLVAELKKNQDQIDVLKPRLETLKVAQALTEKWGGVLDHLSKSTPEHLWLTSLRSAQVDQTKPLQITFVGMSDSQQTIGEMIMRLQQCKELEKVTFKRSSERADGQIKYYEFEIVADLAGTKKEEAPKEKTS